jgi:hypothetical protein
MASPSIANVRLGCWVFILIYWLAASVFQGAAPALQTFDYTYQRPIGTPGVLQSQRYSFYYWVTALFVTVWVVPLSLAFALDDTKGKASGTKGPPMFWRIIVHIVLVALLLMWYVAIFIYGLTLWANANGTGPGNVWNPANDPRWCCVYYNLENHATSPEFPCVNTAPCSPGVDATMLATNPVFLYQLWFGFIFIVALVVDILLVTCLVRPTYAAHAAKQDTDQPASAIKKAYLERLL